MKTFGEKLKLLRKSKGLTQSSLASELGFSDSSTISQWERDVNTPYGRDLVKLSKLFGVSTDYMLGIDLKDNKSDYTYYPTAISAGLPLTVDGITEASKISISDEVLGKYANDRDIFFVRANGDSMNNLFEDGSLLAIKPITLDNLKNSDIVVYSTNGEYSVKHYHKTPTNIIFRANSRTFEYFDDIHELDSEIKIHGKVVTYIVNVD